MYFELKKSRLEITPRNDVTNSSNHPILSNFNWLTEITKKKKRIMMRYSAFFVPSHFYWLCLPFLFLFFSWRQVARKIFCIHMLMLMPRIVTFPIPLVQTTEGLCCF